MKRLLIIVVVFVLGGVLGGLYWGNVAVSLGVSESVERAESKENKPLYWVAPMDKNYQRDAPGLSPMGMALVPVYEKLASDAEGEVTISPVVVNNLGVKTAPVYKGPLIMPLETVGIVKFDERHVSHVHSRVEGWVEVLNVFAAGEPVKKGQTLYELYSPALINAQEEYLAALRSGNTSLIKASELRVISLGLDKGQIADLRKKRKVEQRIKVLAEQDGVVVELNVRQGMFISPSIEIMSIGSLDSVWVIGDIFERQSYLVEKGQAVEIKVNAIPGKIWTGFVNHIHPQLNPTTRTLSVRIQINNPDHLLKPNMLADLRVDRVGGNDSLSIPVQALIKSGQHMRVVKALGEGRYKSVLVNSGFEGLATKALRPHVQILSGLSAGDVVVTSAQFLIDSESNIDAELARISADEVVMSEHEAHHETSGKTVKSIGLVNSVMSGMSMVNLTHEPIPELDWPEMKMNFPVSESVDLNAISLGAKVSFSLLIRPDNNFEIVEILEIGSDERMSEMLNGVQHD